MNPVRIVDNGSDISSIVDWKSVDAISILTKEVGSFTFSVIANAASLPNNLPQIGDTIELYDSSGIIWGGTLTEQEPIISGLMITFQYTATDWGFLMDGTLVKKNYSGVDPSAIAIDIINTFCAGKGISAATVADGGHVQVGNFEVPTIQFNYQQPSKALQSLAKLIGRRYPAVVPHVIRLHRGHHRGNARRCAANRWHPEPSDDADRLRRSL